MSVINDERQGTYAQLATLVEQQRQRKDNVFFIFGGESLGPSMLSSMDRGSHIIDLLNSLSPNVMGVSKREFSYQEDELTLRSYEASFPIVSSNLYDPLTNGNLEGLKTNSILQQNEVKLGFLSIVDPSIVQKYPTDRVQILPPQAAVQNTAKTLRQQGIDFIILHYSSYSPQVDEWLEQGIIDLALFVDQNFQLTPYYNHPHHPNNFVLSRTAYALILDIAPADTKHSEFNITKQEVDLRTLASKPDVWSQEMDYGSRLNTLLSKTIGTTSTNINLTRRDIRTTENAFANFVADVLKDFTEADISLLNSGTLRGNKRYPAGSQLSIKDIRGIIPYRNTMVLIEVKGQQILDALEHGLSGLATTSGQFLQVSGIQVIYNSRQPIGNRLVSASFKGRPIDPMLTYKLATLDYLKKGGDGFDMFTQSQHLDYKKPSSLILSDLILEKVYNEKIISPKIDGRLQDIH
ncbi:bifunctional metallophosphatase/5'-nucleotidase [Marinomonas sp. TW1]|uniref:bifunctional metallophosphatase/5'-nucleotidase n=1 Tax=Marinomonas sp. TW1 TaxID=1561203 RepID=UPI0007AF8AA7|nr:5'-nucleotidase C-terminal domain-containing protein [Marinomonas sp. TW1]KZN14295.1 hypothetical protein OA79_06995 [Marinomonas sp. TW1]